MPRAISKNYLSCMGAYGWWCLFAALLVPQVASKPANQYVGNFYEVDEPCVVMKGVYGKCTIRSGCPHLEEQIKRLGLKAKDVGHCGFTVMEEVICCPGGAMSTSRDIFNTEPTTTVVGTSSTDRSVDTGRGGGGGIKPERKAVQACRRLEENAQPPVVKLVIGGSPVKQGEYPHMVAIGYTEIGVNGPPYQFKCGGSLIEKRFVLTAAHCVNRRDLVVSIVRLGVTDFSDTEQMKEAVDIPIELVHIHRNYNSLQKYNDIAILELKRDVEYTNAIFPACLHTDLSDPPVSAELNVTGWGVVNTRTHKNSDVLLKARVQILPIDRCNASYAVELPQLTGGILNTQLCTHDNTYMSDACWGDSGGPLNLIVDAHLRKMQIVGVVSAGIGCASAAPSLYTRVASYLDFIEGIVWP